MESAHQVLKLMPSTKEGIDKFSDLLFTELEEGHIDPLWLRVVQRCMEKVFENIKERLDELCLDEAGKYGEKSFSYRGFKVQIAEVNTEYDYSVCNYPPLLRLSEQAKKIKQRIDEEKKFLNSLKGPKSINDEMTGEVLEVLPPVKYSKTGIKISSK